MVPLIFGRKPDMISYGFKDTTKHCSGVDKRR